MRRPVLPVSFMPSVDARAALARARDGVAGAGRAASGVLVVAAGRVADVAGTVSFPAFRMPDVPSVPAVLVPDLAAAAQSLRVAGAGVTECTATIRNHAAAMPIPDAAILVDGIAALGDMVRSAVAKVPREREFYVDAAASTAVVGGVVGTATFACAVVVAPAMPLVAVLAPAACSLAGTALGRRLLDAGYRRWAGREVHPDAARIGMAMGSATGTVMGSYGAAAYRASRVRARFRDFGGYSKEARSLTRRELRPMRAEVAAFRVQGFDIDHVIPVKYGWNVGMDPKVIASMGNLQALPSAINRAIGAKGA